MLMPFITYQLLIDVNYIIDSAMWQYLPHIFFARFRRYRLCLAKYRMPDSAQRFGSIDLLCIMEFGAGQKGNVLSYVVFCIYICWLEGGGRKNKCCNFAFSKILHILQNGISARTFTLSMDDFSISLFLSRSNCIYFSFLNVLFFPFYSSFFIFLRSKKVHQNCLANISLEKCSQQKIKSLKWVTICDSNLICFW